MTIFQSEPNDTDNDNEIFHNYQPIFSLSEGGESGVEALIRSKNGSPETLFEKANQAQKLYQLDTESIQKAIITWSAAGGIHHGGLLFLNILPSTLVNPHFPFFVYKLVREYMVPKWRIVLELNEMEKIFNVYISKLLKKRIAFLKKLGFLIAIDDLGKGWASLTTLIDIEPNFAKLDGYFSINLSTSKKKQMMIESVIQYCNGNSIQLILEGIENEVDLETAKLLGVNFGQGFLLGRPKLLDSFPKSQE